MPGASFSYKFILNFYKLKAYLIITVVSKNNLSGLEINFHSHTIKQIYLKSFNSSCIPSVNVSTPINPINAKIAGIMKP